MKNICLLLFSFVSIAGIIVVPKAQKTLLKTFNVNNHQKVTLNLDGAVSVKKWNNPTARVLIQITYHNSNEHMMKYLIRKGRYDLKSTSSEDGLQISSPNLGKTIQISKDGKTLNETVSYKIYVPNNMTVIENKETSIVMLDSEDVAEQ